MLMIILNNALKNIRRYSRKSALYALICVVAVLTLQIYIAGIGRTEKQLNDLPAAMPVWARAASLDGAQFSELQIKPKTIDGLKSSPYVRDLKITISLVTDHGHFPKEYGDGKYRPPVEAANRVDAVEGLAPEDVTWLPGYGPDILESTEPVCIANESLIMLVQGWSLGDIVTMELFKYKYESLGVVTFEEIGVMDVRIVGSAKINGNAEFIMPFETAREFARERNLELNASTASFYVNDMLQLNDFKTEMKKLAFAQAITDGSAGVMVISHSGVALSVYDATFISAATHLRGTISLLKGFLPLMVAALAVIGYFVAYLMIQNRREEYAILRLIGMSRRASIAMYFCEIAILTLGGSFIGAAISTASGIGNAAIGAQVFLLFSLCFILGCAIALFRLGRTNIMLALSRRD